MEAILPFKAVKPQKASTLIAEQILRLLESGELGPGDRLPPERKLAEQFEVNRQAVREALSALQLLGVVRTRPGSGSIVVARVSKGSDIHSEIRRLEGQVNPFEIMEARDVIEPEIVRLASKRAGDSQLGAISKAIEEYETTVREKKLPPSGDLQIHVRLAQASGNSVFVDFMDLVVASADQWLWRHQREKGWDQDRALLYLKHHREIYDAIAAREPRRAARAMKMHLRAVLRTRWGMSS